MEKWELKKEIEKAHDKHAWTLALLVWGIGAAGIYTFDLWLSYFRPGGFAELLRYVVYAIAYFYIFTLGILKELFLRRLLRKEKAT